LKNKNAIQFIVIFITTYLFLNVLYQLVLYFAEPKADLFTEWVTVITGKLFSQSSYKPLENIPGYVFKINNYAVVNIKEGCNGVAVFIAFFSFCLAFKSKFKMYLWFIPLGFILLQTGNIIRLFILIKIKLFYPQNFNFYHVYVFPAIIYLVAFLMMVWWVCLNHQIAKNG